MIISRYYDEIFAGAIELLNNPAGFNGYSQDEMRAWNRSQMRGMVGVALCYARDEVEARLKADSPVADVREAVRFNTGNFRRAETEITRTVLRLFKKPAKARRSVRKDRARDVGRFF